MRTVQGVGAALLVLAAGLGLTGCRTGASALAEDAIAAASSVEPAADGGPARLHLTDESVLRLGIDTAPVQDADDGLTMPYAAVVYDAEGSSWAFTELEPGLYQRAAVTIESVDGDEVLLSDGPVVGTEVVVVGAAELVGVEAGISGGE